MRYTVLLLLSVLLSAPDFGGVVIVNHDEWTLTQNGANAAQFGANIANYFAGGSGENLLICTTNPGLNNSTLINAITAAGHTATADTGITFSLPTLSAYTGIFMGGELGWHNATVLTDYVNNGGNVYLAGGTGSIYGEDTLWDPFLGNFGFDFGTSCNGIAGTFAPSSSHPIFAGIGGLYYNNGNTVILTGSTPYAHLIAVQPGTGAGLIGIYDVDWQPGGEIPEPSTLTLLGSGFWRAAGCGGDEARGAGLPSSTDWISRNKAGIEVNCGDSGCTFALEGIPHRSPGI